MNQRIKPVDYSKMTEEEFFAFLDAEALRIRQDNIIRPLDTYHKKLARVGTEQTKEKGYNYKNKNQELCY
jgi:methionyl-tRNA synthetase